LNCARSRQVRDDDDDDDDEVLALMFREQSQSLLPKRPPKHIMFFA